MQSILIGVQVFCWQKFINPLEPKPQNFRSLRFLKFCGFGPALESEGRNRSDKKRSASGQKMVG
jgi:hypothetical protein